MGKVVLYMGISLDGYIADADNGVEWMNLGIDEEKTRNSYSCFIRQADRIVMGWNTYHQIITQLSADTWVYPEQITYVVTSKKESFTQQIRLVNEDPCRLVKRLRQEKGKDIWICGGASLAGQLMEADLIDRYHLCILPVLLGKGLSLFKELENRIPLKLMGAENCGGMAEVIYEREPIAPAGRI